MSLPEGPWRGKPTGTESLLHQLVEVLDQLRILLTVGGRVDPLEIAAVLKLSSRLDDLLEVAKVDAEDVVWWAAEGARTQANSKSLQVSLDEPCQRPRGVEEDL